MSIEQKRTWVDSRRLRLLCEAIAAHERGRGWGAKRVEHYVYPGGYITKAEVSAGLVAALNEARERSEKP